MNTSLWIGSVLLCIAPMSVFGAEVTLGSATVAPAATATIDASYLSEGSQVSGIQFDLFYDNTVMSVTATLGSVGANAKTLFSAGVNPNQVRVAIVGQNQDVVPDGAVVSLSVTVLPGAPDGTYPISLIGGAASDPTGEAVGFSTVPATITVKTPSGGGTSGVMLSWVLNAASLLPGPVAPGELVALFGTNIGPPQAELATAPEGMLATSLSGVSVVFSGTSTAAPLLYADPRQINLVVPYELAGRTTTVLSLLHNGAVVASFNLSVTPVSPALFTLEADGVGQVVAFNEDGTLNTPVTPAAAGSLVTLFLNGCGQSNPLGLTGQMLSPSQTGQLLLPVAASVQGLLTTVGYAGPAPGSVNSVSLIQIRIPAAVSSTTHSGLSVRIGNVWTPENVTIAVTSGTILF